MSLKRQLVKAIKIIFKKFRKSFLVVIKRQINWLLRTLFLSKKRRSSVNAGFVLPTVAMVALVVILLTTAILFRSFERSKNASNVRVNEVVLNAATPAIDRARAKIDALLEDPTLPRGTPSDSALYDALTKSKYNLGDEVRLKLAVDFNGTSGIQTSTTTNPLPLEQDETLKTAWKYAVDTDNNGKKDTFTLYGIYFRTPTRNASTGQFNRKRNPLEARTPPMDNASTNTQCSNAAGFSTLVGNSSWYQLQSGNLGKSFFVYTVNIPITQAAYNAITTNQNQYEPYKGNKSVAAIEFQQDRSRVPLPNNAVWFENDLEIIVGSTDLLLNGRIHTNGNLLVGRDTGSLVLRQVSSQTSCFYNQENGLISVGGNVGTGNVNQTTNQSSVTVDLYRGFGTSPAASQISSTEKSTSSNGGSQIGFNDTVYNQRIALMKTDGLAACTACQSATTASAVITAVNASGYPDDVKRNVAAKVKSTDDAATAKNVLADEVEIYLRNRTRRVPFAEAASTYTTINASLTPQATWREPINSSNQLTGTTITLNETRLSATYPTFQKQKGTQLYLGDRVFVGNNLPARWLLNGQYVGSDGKQFVRNSSGNGINWTEPPSPDPAQNQKRWRNTQIQAIADLGISDRNGFWEEKAAENPINDLDSVGGVRIVTGAGIYVDGTGNTVNTTTGPFYPRGLRSFLQPTSSSTVVWPDTMPMSTPADATKKGDLLMRATAVYHYKVDYGIDQEPIACVSSYYDPTDSTTAKNKVNQDGGYGVDTTNGRSNNGVVYNFPGRSTFTTNKTLLQLQANLRFPNGRWVNEPLKDALAKVGAGTTVPSTGLQLSHYSAIDTALCAISILNNEAGFATTLTNKPPHGAIKEGTFLDAREAKQISASSTSTTYDLDLEQRQPLEVRVTDIDLSELRGTVIATSEYLLPYSGIIYATREDALRDASETNTPSESELLSPTDFKLDPTRRPNGIRLINGETLARKTATDNNAYVAKEKGLILVTNLPAYIKGKFNVHQPSLGSATELEEFTEKEPTTNFYLRTTAETRFACRRNRGGCPTTNSGDYWRPSTIIADSMTLLSGSYVDGFRSDGDYNLNNNTGIPINGNLDFSNLTYATISALDDTKQKRLQNGFVENYFATNASWWQTSGTDKNFPTANAGSYARNGVTPIQRRIDDYPMYVMEMCRKDLIEQCTPNDWVVGFDMNGDQDLADFVSFDWNGDGDTTDTGETSLDLNGDGDTTDTGETSLDLNGDGDTTDTSLGEGQSFFEKDIKTYHLGKAIATSAGSTTATTTALSNWDAPFPTSSGRSIRQRLGAGDTGDKSALVSADKRYPRRVAFARNDTNQLVTSGTPATYKPMGIACPLDTTGNTYANNGCIYATGTLTEGTHYGKRGNSALWFRTIVNTVNDPTDIANVRYHNVQSLFYYPPIDGSDADTNPDLDGQPRLVPVLQIHNAEDTASNNSANVRADNAAVANDDDYRYHWLQVPSADTTFNTTFVLGNSPSRPEEVSAGLQNLVRFLEAWSGRSSTTFSRAAKISGSFIQLKRSTYSTAPIAPIFDARTSTTSSATDNLSLFDYALDNYPTQNGDGVLPAYSPPDRKWGFDVGLLSEQPDLFAQRFTLPSTGRPNEFFREVGRDDVWVKTLLCAGQPASGVTYTAAVPSEYRPSGCPSIPND